MAPGSSMLHSQELSNKPYPEPNQPNSSYWYLCFKIHSNIVFPFTLLGLTKGLFLVGIPVKILKALLLSSILATWPANLNLLDSIAPIH